MTTSLDRQNNVHELSLDRYTMNDLRQIEEKRPKLQLGRAVREKIRAGARFVHEKLREDQYIYGVNTGFGSLCEERVADDEVESLQLKHVVSHACGVGEIVPERISRLVLLIKLLTFRTGHTGISLETVERLLELWNRNIVPAIPKKGTVGASGDLAPLAHMALPLLGMGEVYKDGSLMAAPEALRETGLQPLRLGPKEGLALTNGVQYINAIATDLWLRIDELARAADLVAALSIQGFSASHTFYQELYHETSWHEERRVVARNLRRLLEGSNHSRLPTCNKSRQDPYSFRCIPQIHGAIRQAVGFARQTITNEVNGVSDNPLFFPDDDVVLFGGNLHGESTALVLDFLAIATSELANVSERRTYQLLSGQRGLPSFLVKRPGLDSGFMIAQYTSAALVNENKVLSTPASVDTIPTCQLQEDHVSMGGTAAYKLREIVENTEYVLGVELLTACQAAEMNEGLELSHRTREVWRDFRRNVDFLEEDRVLSGDMEASRAFLVERLRDWIRRYELD